MPPTIQLPNAIFTRHKRPNYVLQSLLILLCMAMGGCMALYFGKDLSWDLANYHFYNAYAFLHHRWNYDYWPSSNIHVHFTPTLDLLTYFLIIHFKPMMVVFLIGAIQGLNIWLLYLLARAILTSLNFPYARLTAVITTLMGIYGPTAFPGMGSFQQDNLVSILVLAFIYLHWRNLNSLRCYPIRLRDANNRPVIPAKAGTYPNNSCTAKWVPAFAGMTERLFASRSGIARRQPQEFSSFLLNIPYFLLGLAIGCKLTAAMYAIAAIISSAFLSIVKPVKLVKSVKSEKSEKSVNPLNPLNPHKYSTIVIPAKAGIQTLHAILFTATGILVTSGYWMLFLWQNYHNPFFPLFNQFFHSPYFPAYNWHDTRFLPTNIWQAILFPFYFSFDGQTNDYPFRDFRFLIAFVVGLIYITKLVITKSHAKLNRNGTLVIARSVFCDEAIHASASWIASTCKKHRFRNDAGRVVTSNLANQWFICFFLLTYIIWEWNFSIMRYAVVLEMLAPLFIVMLLSELITTDWIRSTFVILLASILFSSLAFTTTIRLPSYQGNYFNVQLPADMNKIPNAIVFIAYPAYALYDFPKPQTYLIPFFPSSWRFIGMPFSHYKYDAPSEMQTFLQRYRGHPIFLLSDGAMLPQMYQFAMDANLRPAAPCSRIFSDRQSQLPFEAAYLCPFKRENG